VFVCLLSPVLLAGCQPGAPTASEPALVEPPAFAAWPRATEKPVRVDLRQWLDCRAPTPAEVEAEAKRHGPHARYSIVVRVSPDGIAPFREGKPLPPGAVVVKEKYADWEATGPLQAYAVMTKREAGYDPGGGDWEYAYVTLVPERKESRGRLAGCAGCHASAKERDYLFRHYGPEW
jgi:hypothetical protein